MRYKRQEMELSPNNNAKSQCLYILFCKIKTEKYISKSLPIFLYFCIVAFKHSDYYNITHIEQNPLFTPVLNPTISISLNMKCKK